MKEASITGLTMDIAGIEKPLQPVFLKYSNDIVAAYLFGSAARREITQKSDIDIAVFLRGARRDSVLDLRLSLHADLCRALRRDDIDLVVLNTSANLVLLDEIVRSGILLFDGDTDVREEFESRTLHDSIEFKQHRLKVMGF